MIKVLIHSQVQGEMWLLKESLEEANSFVEESKLSQHYGNEEECSFEVIDVTAEINQKKINEEALKYLAETDWYIVRKAETGKEVPADILSARQMARDSIVK